MALILDKLKVDNVEMRIHEIAEYSDVQSVRITTANTWTDLAAITLPAKGIYLIAGFYAFYSESTTGATRRSLALRSERSGETAITMLEHSFIDGTNAAAQKSIFRYCNTSDYERTITLRALSDKTTTTASTASLYGIKMIDLGGVVRHLKSVVISTFYRPRFYGKAVA